MKDLKHHLEVALVVEGISGNELARRFEISATHLWNVARGETKSKPLRPKIVEFIKLAQQKDPLREPLEIAA